MTFWVPSAGAAIHSELRSTLPPTRKEFDCSRGGPAEVQQVLGHGNQRDVRQAAGVEAVTRKTTDGSLQRGKKPLLCLPKVGANPRKGGGEGLCLLLLARTAGIQD